MEVPSWNTRINYAFMWNLRGFFFIFLAHQNDTGQKRYSLFEYFRMDIEAFSIEKPN